VTRIFAGTNEIMKTIAARFMGCRIVISKDQAMKGLHNF